MIDYEKVKKGLESCIGHCNFHECPYHTESCDEFGCNGNQVLTDALELLKWQDGTIRGLRADLDETLEVVAKQLNVVRCKDCKYGEQCNQNLGEFYLCGKDIGTFETSVHEPDWFCADGELAE